MDVCCLAHLARTERLTPGEGRSPAKARSAAGHPQSERCLIDGSKPPKTIVQMHMRPRAGTNRGRRRRNLLGNRSGVHDGVPTPLSASSAKCATRTAAAIKLIKKTRPRNTTSLVSVWTSECTMRPAKNTQAATTSIVPAA
jgi:hypothetical protein